MKMVEHLKMGAPLYPNVLNWIVKMLKLKKGLITVPKSIKLDMVKTLMVDFLLNLNVKCIYHHRGFMAFYFSKKYQKKDTDDQSCQLLEEAHIWILGAETLEQNTETQKQKVTGGILKVNVNSNNRIKWQKR